MTPDFRTRTGRPGERGAAVAELAMVLPIMLAMLLVVFDFGQGFLAYISVTNGARDGARVAAEHGMDCVADKAVIKQAALDSAKPYAVVVPDPVVKSGMCAVTVQYTYTPILPFVTASFELPMIGRIGPLWNGTMSEEMLSK